MKLQTDVKAGAHHNQHHHGKGGNNGGMVMEVAMNISIVIQIGGENFALVSQSASA